MSAKIYALIAAFLLGIGLFGGAFHYGRTYERQIQEEQKNVNFKASVDQALKIADKFALIARDFVSKLSSGHEATEVITKTQVKYVTQYIHDHPEIEPALVVPAPVMQLRRCQISRIRKAAGASVQSGSDEALCSSLIPQH